MNTMPISDLIDKVTVICKKHGMENKFINRYLTFCKSLDNLEKSRDADPKADFVLEGTVLNFNLTFDIAWKVMKDIITVYLPLLEQLRKRVETYYQ